MAIQLYNTWTGKGSNAALHGREEVLRMMIVGYNYLKKLWDIINVMRKREFRTQKILVALPL